MIQPVIPIRLHLLRDGLDGNGAESMTRTTRTLAPKTAGAKAARSVCPYCAVGCGQLIYHKDGRLVSVEGDPASPIVEPQGVSLPAAAVNRNPRFRYSAYSSRFTMRNCSSSMKSISPVVTNQGKPRGRSQPQRL